MEEVPDRHHEHTAGGSRWCYFSDGATFRSFTHVDTGVFSEYFSLSSWFRPDHSHWTVPRAGPVSAPELSAGAIAYVCLAVFFLVAITGSALVLRRRPARGQRWLAAAVMVAASAGLLLPLIPVTASTVAECLLSPSTSVLDNQRPNGPSEAEVDRIGDQSCRSRAYVVTAVSAAAVLAGAAVSVAQVGAAVRQKSTKVGELERV